MKVGLGRVLETGTENVGIGFIGHGSAGDVPQSAVEVGGDVVGAETSEHEPHEGLGVGRGAELQSLIELFGRVVVLLRHLIGERDSDMHHIDYFLGVVLVVGQSQENQDDFF